MVEKLEVGVETSPLTISPGSRHGACLKDRNAEKMKTRNVLFLHSGQRTIIKRTTCGQGIVLLGLVGSLFSYKSKFSKQKDIISLRVL